VPIINVTGRVSEISDHAAVVLPITVEHERQGTTTNVEGRVSALAAGVAAPGQAWADWMVAVGLADALGADLGFSSLDDVLSEIATLAGSHRGLSASVLAAAAGDGVLVPVHDGGAFAPAPQDPMAFPGVKVTPAKATFTESTESSVGQLGEVATQGFLSAIDAELTAPAPDGYALRLIAATTLFDATPQTMHAPSLAGLIPQTVATVNPSDLDRLGLAAGAIVRLKSASGQVELPAATDATVARGTVVVMARTAPLGADGAANVVATLVDATALVTDVRMESR
jgi:predicted molibdopterin-dependent oxidoreductase YjgC